VTKLLDADQQFAVLLQLMQEASYSADPHDLAQRVISGLKQHFESIASAIWLYAPPQYTCLHAYNLDHIRLGDRLEYAMTGGTPVFAEVESPATQPPATHMLSIFPLTVEQATLGALVVVTAAPLDRTARLVVQALAGYLGARLQTTQTRLIAEQRRSELAASNHGWNEFIGQAAHEIKNPLASVKGYADLLLRRANDAPGDPFRKGLTIISEQTARATELLSDMSDTARLDSNRLLLDLSTVNLTEVVRRLADEQNDPTSQHTIVLDCEDEPIYCRCDQTRLMQVLRAMLSNAIKFSPTGGPILVRLRRSTEQAELEAVISVTDHGVGVPAEEQRDVFDRFKRGSNIRGQFGGLGLGLFAAREIVRRHDGRMWLESEPELGTTCFVALPLR
jgi:two-component system, LuxR family, sensor kinase FixL